MKKLIIFGTGKLSELVHYYFENDSEYVVEAFTVDEKYLKENTFNNLPVLPFENIEEKYSPNEYEMFIAISHADLNSFRTNKFNEAKEKGYKLATYISSKAIVWPDLQIGENCLVAENVTIMPYTKIGNNNIIFCGSTVAHHGQIENNCFFAPHVVLAGGVKVEDNCFFGLNSTVGEDLTIAKYSIIGANALILKDTNENCGYLEDYTKYCGVPSDRLKSMLQKTRGW